MLFDILLSFDVFNVIHLINFTLIKKLLLKWILKARTTILVYFKRLSARKATIVIIVMMLVRKYLRRIFLANAKKRKTRKKEVTQHWKVKVLPKRNVVMCMVIRLNRSISFYILSFRRSSTKFKKSKSFKFSAKHKEKREKVKDREIDKKKSKDKKYERSKDKLKVERKDRKNKSDEKVNIGDALPIFGVNLQLSVERSHCHDGVDLPLPVRECIDYIQEEGINTENVYKLSGLKAKVLQIKKMYNQREPVNLSEYDVPTATSVLKLFFREMPEPILDDLTAKFEEVASIQNVPIRETSFKSLIEKLPIYNRTILAWTILHLDTIVNNQKHTKMNAQSLSLVLSPVLQMSQRLLMILLNDCKVIFKDVQLFRYQPPLTSSTIVNLPEEIDDINAELKKQESLLSQIHSEMNSGFISKSREELLWEVQRMITQLKRKLRSIQKFPENLPKNVEEEATETSQASTMVSDEDNTHNTQNSEPVPSISTVPLENSCFDKMNSRKIVCVPNQPNVYNTHEPTSLYSEPSTSKMRNTLPESSQPSTSQPKLSNMAISLIQHENTALLELKSSLLAQIAAEKSEIVFLKYCLANNNQQQTSIDNSLLSNIDFKKLDEITDLIKKENRILQIKKIDLIREIMENREACIYLQSKLLALSDCIG